MTSMPAQRAGLKSRGTLAAGMAADITVFDPATVTDRATFDEPKRLSAGVKHVLVSGTFVLRDGEFTGERPGRLLVRGED